MKASVWQTARQCVSPNPVPCPAEVHIDGRIFFAFSKYVPKTPESLAKVPWGRAAMVWLLTHSRVLGS